MVVDDKKIKIGDLIKFRYTGYEEKIIAVIVDIYYLPEYDNITYIYIYAQREAGYVFLEPEEIKDLEVL